jgi:hypothetical protein
VRERSTAKRSGEGFALCNFCTDGPPSPQPSPHRGEGE